MSPKSINKALDLLGEDLDLLLQNWKGNITAHLEKCYEKAQEGRDLERRQEELAQLAAARQDADEQMTAVNVSLSSLSEEKEKLAQNWPSSFNIVLDNVDLKVLAWDMTSNDQNKDFHWCNHNVYLDRVNVFTGRCTNNRSSRSAKQHLCSYLSWKSQECLKLGQVKNC